MASRERIKAGDLLAINISEEMVVAGIVLHVSKRFYKGMIIGFYNRLFTSRGNINIDTLKGEFVDTPNYIPVDLVLDGVWKKIGNSPQLLAEAAIPELRVAFDIYYKDTIVRKVDFDEFKNYTELKMMGQPIIENKLREHFTRA